MVIARRRQEPLVARFERLATALHDAANLLPDAGILEATRPVRDHGALTVHMIHGDHPLGIAVDHDVRIVSHHDDLSPALVLTDLSHDQVMDDMVVEVVLGLVEYDGLVPVREEEGEDGGRLLSG